jgi:Kinesin-associated protein (KAP)
MLEAHPREKSIIVNYKLEAAVYGEGDMLVDPMLADKKVSRTFFFATTIQGL